MTKQLPETRAAERFFKERRVTIHMVDLKQKPLAPGEIIVAVVDKAGKAIWDGGSFRTNAGAGTGRRPTFSYR